MPNVVREMTEKYKDRVSANRFTRIKRQLAAGNTATWLGAVISSDEALLDMLIAFLKDDRQHRERALHVLLPKMRANAVPEDLIWALACAATDDSIAQAMLILIKERNQQRAP